MTPRKSEQNELFPEPDPSSGTDWTLLDRLLAMDEVRTIFLHGPPGLGKTYSAYRHGRLDRGIYAITLTEDTAASELRGFYTPREDGIAWQDGPFTMALREGARLVINEITHASAECLSLLHPILESQDTARLTLPTGETIVPAEGFHVVVTDNAAPGELPPALEDRFDCIVGVTDPHPDALAALREPFRRAARRSCQLDEERRISLRSWFSVQKLEPALGLESACEAVFGAERGQLIHDALRIAVEPQEESVS